MQPVSGPYKVALPPGLQDVAVCRDSGEAHVPIASGLITLPDAPCTTHTIMTDHHGAHDGHQESSAVVASCSSLVELVELLLLPPVEL